MVICDMARHLAFGEDILAQPVSLFSSLSPSETLMAADERENRDEIRILLNPNDVNVEMMRSSYNSYNSCTSCSSAVVPGELKWEQSKMVKIELDAARALAEFSQLALLERESPGGESKGNKWGNKRRRSKKRVASELSTMNGNLEQLNLNNSGLVEVRKQGCAEKARGSVIVKAVKVEEAAELPRVAPIRSTSYLPFGGGKSKQHLTEAEKEARRLRRVLANRESARQTIRRRQAMSEELSKKAADLAWDNESMKKEKELVMKEYQSLKDTNNQLKAQMSGKVMDKTEQFPSSTQIQVPSYSPGKPPFLLQNKPPFTPYVWPSIIRPLNPVQTQAVSPSATASQNSISSLSHDPGNATSTDNGPRSPFFILPFPWFFPVPDHVNILQSQLLDSGGSAQKRDNEAGSSSNTMRIMENKQQPSVRRVKTEACNSYTDANSSNNLPNHSNNRGDLLESSCSNGLGLMSEPLRTVKPKVAIKSEPRRQQDSTTKEDSVFSKSYDVRFTSPEKLQGLDGYPSSDTTVTAEARKRRKELTKLKNLHCCQVRLPY